IRNASIKITVYIGKNYVVTDIYWFIVNERIPLSSMAYGLFKRKVISIDYHSKMCTASKKLKKSLKIFTLQALSKYDSMTN
ncbi:TPA: hypothetical protein ACJHIN_001373, partial [Staphylococcus pseudintermedius]